jgi:hypothetical protein
VDLAESVDDGTVDRHQASRILNVVDSRHYHPLVVNTEFSLLDEVLDPRSERRRRQCTVWREDGALANLGPPSAPDHAFALGLHDLNDPSLLGRRHQCRQSGVRRKASQVVLRRLRLVRPFDQHPLLRQRFPPLASLIRRPDTLCRKAGLQRPCAIAPGSSPLVLGGGCSRKILGQNGLVVRRTLAQFGRAAPHKA